MAINALEEVQQYRTIGTPEELKAAMKYVYLAKNMEQSDRLLKIA